MSRAEYRLTEEVVRQAIEVLFRDIEDWVTCFVNPTAGPWKVIRFPKGDESVVVDRYLKEQNRPDLVLFSKTADLFMIVEVKPSVSALVNEWQMCKTLEVFHDEIARFESLAEIHLKTGAAQFRFACGFGFPSGDIENDLIALHEAFVAQVASVESELRSYLVFVVVKKKDENLEVLCHCESSDDDLLSVLRNSLPPDLKSID